jgi:hypothetical protein
LSFEQASLDAIRLIAHLRGLVGSEQRPHQKTQSIQKKTLDSTLLAPNVGLSEYAKKEVKKEKSLVLFRT